MYFCKKIIKMSQQTQNDIRLFLLFAKKEGVFNKYFRYLHQYCVRLALIRKIPFHQAVEYQKQWLFDNFMSRVIIAAFDWVSTTEGFDYWFEVDKKWAIFYDQHSLIKKNV